MVQRNNNLSTLSEEWLLITYPPDRIRTQLFLYQAYLGLDAKKAAFQSKGTILTPFSLHGT